MDGWVHAFDLDLDGLRVLDFREAGVFAWVAELMKHRDADESSAADPQFNRLVRLFNDLVKEV